MFARLAGREPQYSAEVPIVYHRIVVHCLQCKRRVEPAVLGDQSTIVGAYRTPRIPTIPQLMAAPCTSEAHFRADILQPSIVMSSGVEEVSPRSLQTCNRTNCPALCTAIQL